MYFIQWQVRQCICENYGDKEEKRELVPRDILLEVLAAHLIMKPIRTRKMLLLVFRKDLFIRESLRLDLGRTHVVYYNDRENVHKNLTGLILLTIRCVPSLCEVDRLSYNELELDQVRMLHAHV